MNCKVWCMLAASILFVMSDAQRVGAVPVDTERLSTALERSIVYLQREGRAWFEGEVAFQEKGCVSCHQVPSGTWSLSAAYDALQQEPRPEFTALLMDATKFAADAEVGRAAMWSQFLIAARARREKAQTDEDDLVDTYVPLILKAQQDNGSWPAKGQFPFQRRPIVESDAVVTMWMIHALQSSNVDSRPVEASIQRGRIFVESGKGASTEWVAWRLLLSDSSEPDAATFGQQLVAQQNPNGSWGWAKGEPGNAYSTGVALYALAATSDELGGAVEKATRYLLTQQLDDGSWLIDSRLISKEGGDSLDYVYRYWSTAWATIGLAELLKDTRHN